MKSWQIRGCRHKLRRHRRSRHRQTMTQCRASDYRPAGGRGARPLFARRRGRRDVLGRWQARPVAPLCCAGDRGPGVVFVSGPGGVTALAVLHGAGGQIQFADNAGRVVQEQALDGAAVLVHASLHDPAGRNAVQTSLTRFAGSLFGYRRNFVASVAMWRCCCRRDRRSRSGSRRPHGCQPPFAGDRVFEDQPERASQIFREFVTRHAAEKNADWRSGPE